MFDPGKGRQPKSGRALVYVDELPWKDRTAFDGAADGPASWGLRSSIWYVTHSSPSTTPEACWPVVARYMVPKSHSSMDVGGVELVRTYMVVRGDKCGAHSIKWQPFVQGTISVAYCSLSICCLVVNGGSDDRYWVDMRTLPMALFVPVIAEPQVDLNSNTQPRNRYSWYDSAIDESQGKVRGLAGCKGKAKRFVSGTKLVFEFVEERTSTMYSLWVTMVDLRDVDTSGGMTPIPRIEFRLNVSLEW